MPTVLYATLVVNVHYRFRPLDDPYREIIIITPLNFCLPVLIKRPISATPKVYQWLHVLWVSRGKLTQTFRPSPSNFQKEGAKAKFGLYSPLRNLWHFTFQTVQHIGRLKQTWQAPVVFVSQFLQCVRIARNAERCTS